MQQMEGIHATVIVQYLTTNKGTTRVYRWRQKRSLEFAWKLEGGNSFTNIWDNAPP